MEVTNGCFGENVSAKHRRGGWGGPSEARGNSLNDCKAVSCPSGRDGWDPLCEARAGRERPPKKRPSLAQTGLSERSLPRLLLAGRPIGRGACPKTSERWNGTKMNERRVSCWKGERGMRSRPRAAWRWCVDAESRHDSHRCIWDKHLSVRISCTTVGKSAVISALLDISLWWALSFSSVPWSPAELITVRPSNAQLQNAFNGPRECNE